MLQTCGVPWRVGRWRVGCSATKGLMSTCPIVISLKRLQLALQISGAPEWGLIEKLSPYCSNEPLNERMRERDIRNRLDLCNFEDSKISLPSMEVEQRIIIRAQARRHRPHIVHKFLPTSRAISSAGNLHTECGDESGDLGSDSAKTSHQQLLAGDRLRAIESLAELAPDTAQRIVENKIEEVSIEALAVDDVVLVLPNSR